MFRCVNSKKPHSSSPDIASGGFHFRHCTYRYQHAPHVEKAGFLSVYYWHTVQYYTFALDTRFRHQTIRILVDCYSNDPSHRALHVAEAQQSMENVVLIWMKYNRAVYISHQEVKKHGSRLYH